MSADTSITLENEHCRIVISPRGWCEEFVDKATGRNCVAAPGPVACVTVGGAELPCSSASMDGGRLHLAFRGSDVVVVLRVLTERRSFTFTVEQVEGKDVTGIEFARFRLKSGPDGEFALCVLALNLQTNVTELPGANEVLRALCYPRFGFAGAKAALLACPRDQLRNAMQDAVSASPELPHSSIGGPWALDGEINRGSYLFNFGGLSEESAGDWIRLAKALGFTQIDFHGGNSFRFGDCRPNPETYPQGRASLKAVVNTLHTSGIKAGLHTYAFFIDKACPWVTPVPDGRLASDATFTLAGDIPADADRVPVVESTDRMSTITGFFVRNSVTLHIDDELIVYGGIESESSRAFAACRRGAYGTVAAPHAGGAKVHHLKECFGLFVPDPATTLFEDVAAATADTFNECGFDMIYLDALDGEDILGGPEYGWHYGSRFVFEIWKRLRRPALQEMSTFHHHLWSVRSRLGAWDHPVRSHKRFIDIHVAANGGNRRMFMPGMLGWWAVKTWQGAQGEPTFSDDIEYLCCKAIGTGDGLALMGVDPENIKTSPVLARLAEIFRQYEDLRHAKYFSEELRNEMAMPGKEFSIAAGRDGKASARPVSYVRHKVEGADDRTKDWFAENDYREQTPFIRIEALLSCAAYDSADAMPLTDFTDEDLPFRAASAGVKASRCASDFAGVPSSGSGRGEIRGHDPISPSASDYVSPRFPTGLLVASGPAADAAMPSSAAFSATDHGIRISQGRVTSWAQWEKSLSPPSALGERQALGVWICGDGQGELVNFQLRSPHHISGGIADHYVDIDFRGWRYFELVEPEGERAEDYTWPYASYIYGLYRELVNFDQVATLGIWLNALPPGREVRCGVGLVKALPLVKATLRNPKVMVNDATVEFPIEMESGSYLEFRSADDCRLYGPGGELIGPVTPRGAVPSMRPGRNSLSFACGVAPGVNPRARVTVGLMGEPRK